jgi:DNA polymerase
MSETKKELLQEIFEEVEGCQKCDLYGTPGKCALYRGNPDSEVVFVGEALGAEEAEQGQPFVGRAGKLLDNMVKAMGFKRDDVYICNICNHRPPGNRKPTFEETECCKPYLIKQLDIVKPKVIITLGATAMESLLGPGLGIMKRRGQWGKYNGIPTMLTYHPSFCLRRHDMKPDVWKDLQKVMEFLGRPVKENDDKTAC